VKHNIRRVQIARQAAEVEWSQIEKYYLLFYLTIIVTFKMVYKYYLYLIIFSMSITLRLLLSRNIVRVPEGAVE